MKLSILIATMFFCCVVFVNADYTHVIESGYSAVLSLEDHETLLMTGGGLNDLNLSDWSSATIQGTSPLVEFSGGIWEIYMSSYSLMDFSGGEVHELIISDNCRATLSGGSFDVIRSYQTVDDVWVEGTDPPEYVPDPHIEMICWDWNWNSSTRHLSGTWEDYTTFNIYLSDFPETQHGYDPAIENFSFTIIPEPATLLLLGLGGLLIRRK